MGRVLCLTRFTPFVLRRYFSSQTMHPEQQPITGAEYHTNAPATPRGALAQFYAAFNGSDIDLMAENWDHGDDAVMDNPIGGIARGWDSIRPIYERLFGGTAQIQVE